MPDISMCKEICPLSKECYRHEDSGTKPTRGRQSYFLDISDQAGEGCEHFWPIVTERDVEWGQRKLRQMIRDGIIK